MRALLASAPERGERRDNFARSLLLGIDGVQGGDYTSPFALAKILLEVGGWAAQFGWLPVHGQTVGTPGVPNCVRGRGLSVLHVATAAGTLAAARTGERQPGPGSHERAGGNGSAQCRRRQQQVRGAIAGAHGGGCIARAEG